MLRLIHFIKKNNLLAIISNSKLRFTAKMPLSQSTTLWLSPFSFFLGLCLELCTSGAPKDHVSTTLWTDSGSPPRLVHSLHFFQSRNASIKCSNHPTTRSRHSNLSSRRPRRSFVPPVPSRGFLPILSLLA